MLYKIKADITYGMSLAAINGTALSHHLLFFLGRESKGVISLIIVCLLGTSGGWPCLSVLDGFIRPLGFKEGKNGTI